MKKVKILLAMVALVAMVAVASVAHGATTQNWTTNVTNASLQNIAAGATNCTSGAQALTTDPTAGTPDYSDSYTCDWVVDSNVATGFVVDIEEDADPTSGSDTLADVADTVWVVDGIVNATGNAGDVEEYGMYVSASSLGAATHGLCNGTANSVAAQCVVPTNPADQDIIDGDTGDVTVDAGTLTTTHNYFVTTLTPAGVFTNSTTITLGPGA